MKYKYFFIYVFLFFFTVTPIIWAKNQTIKVAVFTTREKGDPFWGIYIDFMQIAANDLGIQLEPYYAKDNKILMRQQVEAAAKRGVDFLIFPNFKDGALSIMKIGESLKTPFFLVNQGLIGNLAGGPREKYKFWIGELLPDDEGAGYQLANLLINQAFKNQSVAEAGKLQILGIGGIISDWASIERVKGLQRAIKDRNDVQLMQIVHSDWKKERSMVSFRLLKLRYPKARVVWVASDLMSIGVIEQANKMGLVPQKDFVTGGIDWSVGGIQSVVDGQMSMTFGGHFMDGSWALVMIYDYLHDKDFKDLGLRYKSQMLPITQQNSELFHKQFLKENLEKLDFRIFSRVENPQQAYYDFSLQRVLRLLRNN